MADWIIDFIGRVGEIGIFLLMLLENVFPPIPSELIMPLAGYRSQTGDMHLGTAIIAGSLGSLLGTSLWYILGRRVGERRLREWVERHGRWLTLSGDDIDKAKGWFDRHGGAAIFFCRLVPALRTVISLPAGFSEMPRGRFLLYTTAGTLLWTSMLAYAGSLLGEHYEQVSSYIGPVSWAVIGFTVLSYVYRLVRQSRYQSTTEPSSES